ncbi:site-specific integrase [Mesorhizobium sp. VNQ89]|uniref:tyrosine-type recombinase/integrase n=1 Tax=Mesorhizobium quangtriensis TaxID=3157709 RepID=UPI0032B75201
MATREKQKLTKRVVDKSSADALRYTVFDSEIRGFGLRVFPSGQKSWIFEYKGAEGGRRAVTRRVTLGAADKITPDEARKLADTLRARVRLGDDPQREKKSLRLAPTVSDLADDFLKLHVKTKRKAGTVDHYEDVLNRLVVPVIGKRKAREVTRSDVSKLHLSLAGTPFQANRVLAVISSMYQWGGKHGETPEGHNPAAGVERFSEDSRERFLTGKEMERLGAAIRLAETDGVPWVIKTDKKSKHVPKKRQATTIDPFASAALRLLLFTGARVGEILSLKWDHVDFDRGLLLLPDSKTGKKAIVLNAPAMEILSTLPHVGAYVIAGASAGENDEKPRSDLKRPWEMVRKQAKLEGLRLHDLRHNFASFGAGGGLGLPIIGKLLGHTQAATTQRYAHLDADPLRRASNAIGAAIAGAMGEAKPKAGESAEIIPLKRQEG